MDNFPLSFPRVLDTKLRCDATPGARVCVESETVISDQCLKWTGLGPSTRAMRVCRGISGCDAGLCRGVTIYRGILNSLTGL